MTQLHFKQNVARVIYKCTWTLRSVQCARELEKKTGWGIVLERVDDKEEVAAVILITNFRSILVRGSGWQQQHWRSDRQTHSWLCTRVRACLTLDGCASQAYLYNRYVCVRPWRRVNSSCAPQQSAHIEIKHLYTAVWGGVGRAGRVFWEVSSIGLPAGVR